MVRRDGKVAAVLGTMGFDYYPCPKSADALPPDLAAEITKLAERFQIELPEVFAMLLEVSAHQRDLAEHGMEAAWRPEESAKRAA